MTKLNNMLKVNAHVVHGLPKWAILECKTFCTRTMGNMV